MKVGDIVIVKDGVGYNSYMQNLVGHIGIVLSKRCGQHDWVQVHILAKTRSIMISDLEVIDESR